ncbi:UNVERIFIED_ORG: TonB-dependent siderophore receptor [Shinella sp. XGS7]|nr:TonB-dependent siderophore receptor [Shinella sp. XGS7]
MKNLHSLSLSLLALLIGQAWADEAPRAADTADAANTLPLVRVQGSKESATGPVPGFVARRAGSGLKSDIPLIETPQSIAVVTADQIEAQGATTLRQTVGYSAGVVSAYFDSRVDSISARGGNVAQYQDGLLRSYGTYNTARPDPFTLERVELVRGPASVLYGQGSLNGVLNLVSKRPLFESRRELQLQLGSHERKQLALDLTGPLGEQWAYRLVAIKRDSGTQVDHVKDDRLLLAPSLTWQPSAATSLTLQALYQRDKSGSLIGFFPWQGTRLPNGSQGQIPTSTFISERGWDAYDSDQDSVGYLFSHRLNADWTLRQNLRHTKSAVDYRTIYTSFSTTARRPLFNADGRRVERDMVWQLNGGSMSLLDTQLEGQLRAGAWKHQLLLGLDAQKNDSTQRSFRGRAPAIDVYAPVYGNFTPPAASALVAQPTVDQRQLGLYLQDHIKFDERWVAVLGLRHDRAKTETQGRPELKADDKATSKRAGLLYLADGGFSPYLAYTESFLPLGGVDFYGKPYKPQVGEQWEAGLKWQPADKRVSATVALYDLRDTNRKTTDPSQPLNSLQIGEVRVRGLELESAGSLDSRRWGRWDWTLGYAYTDAKISRSNAGDQGQAVAGVARHNGSAWLTHHFSLGGRSGFSAGAGLRYLGGSWSGTPLISTPAATLMDAMLAYEQGDWRLALNAVNLADKVQITQCLARGDCFYGQRRTLNATLSYRF